MTEIGSFFKKKTYMKDPDAC